MVCQDTGTLQNKADGSEMCMRQVPESEVKFETEAIINLSIVKLPSYRFYPTNVSRSFR